MVDLTGIVGIPFLKKSRFTGSDGTMCFAVEKRSVEEELRLAAIVWMGPGCYDVTPEEAKRTELFDFTEEGLEKAVDWMNAQDF